MKFPQEPFADPAQYFLAYANELSRALASVQSEKIMAAAKLLVDTISRDAQVFVCGNGGSAAIANHLVCDHVKSVRTDTTLTPRIHSLVANISLFSALANDISYDQVFSYQLSCYARPGDLLLVISSSGDSENIVRALAEAKRLGIPSIAFSGFDGGRALQQSSISLHVDSHNYGIVEDTHQALMHALAQYIRQSHMDHSLIKTRKF